MNTASKPALISIIMPCFNAASHIERSVHSVMTQTYPNWELVIVNDGSTDDTLKVINRLAHNRIRVLHQQNQGVCRSRNRGVMAANGDLIAFLDADDTWDPHFLEKLSHALNLDPFASLAYSGWQNIGRTDGSNEPFVPPDYEALGPTEKMAALFQSCRWPIHACLSKKSAIVEARLFDERILTAEDFLLWLKIGAKHRITRVPEVLAFYHFHGEAQASSNKARGAINHWRAQNAYLQFNPAAKSILGKERARLLMRTELIRRGFERYWKRDLVAARPIFRKAILLGYGTPRQWPYLLPAFLPLRIHQTLLNLLGR